MPQSIVPNTVKIDSTDPINVVNAELSTQLERTILALRNLEQHAELVTGLELDDEGEDS